MDAITAGVAAAVAAYLLTPAAMRLATRVGAIDEPDSGRRIHVRPIPRAGGLAVAGDTAAYVESVDVRLDGTSTTHGPISITREALHHQFLPTVQK